MEKYFQPEALSAYLLPWAGRILFAILIFVVGRWAINFALKTTVRLLAKAQIDPILTTFIKNILHVLLMVVLVIAILDQLGLHTTSLLAVVGAAGLAVGLALKDSLSNFAAGVMLIMFRPFTKGDFIEAAGTSGLVEEIRIFSTRLRSGDNRTIIVPNAGIYSGTIVNNSARDTRRIDLLVSISYDDDIRKAKKLVGDLLQSNDCILHEPAPTINVAELADSSINLNVRPWVKTEDYWTVRSDILQGLKETFDQNGISIPFPQRDIHVHETGKSTQ